MTKELEINGVLDLSESAISMEEFQRKFLILCEENNISFGGVFYELDENGERK